MKKKPSEQTLQLLTVQTVQILTFLKQAKKIINVNQEPIEQNNLINDADT